MYPAAMLGKDVVPEELTALVEQLNTLSGIEYLVTEKPEILELARRQLHLLDRIESELNKAYGLKVTQGDIVEFRDKFKLRINTVSKELDRERSKKTKFVVSILDTETTGLAEYDEPISIGAVTYEIETEFGTKVKELKRFYGLRNPGVPISSSAYAIHGIDISQLQESNFDEEAFIDTIRESDILIAHNAKFDRRMLEKIYPRIRFKVWACSMLGLRRTWDEIGVGRSLDAICNAFKYPRALPHNSLDDCLSLAKVLFTHTGVTEESRTLMSLLTAKPWCPEED